MTTKLTEFNKAPEEQILPRIIANVHSALDQSFPETQSVRPQFAKTVFAGGGESTAANPVQAELDPTSAMEPHIPRMFPDEQSGQFSKEQKTIFVKLQQRTLVDYLLFVLFVFGIGTLVYLFL